MSPKVAFVTGANGITGTGILEHLSKNTKASEWSSIIATSRSSLQSTVKDDRLIFIALDFTEDPKTLAGFMGPICGDVTHAFFSSYVHEDDFAKLNRANQKLFENFLDALLLVAPNLEACVLQTGGKHYNVHLASVPSPAREAEPRMETAIGNFYFQQEDHLFARQRDQSWRWNVIRPEAIIGQTMKPNGMNEALTVAIYLLVCKELGVEAKMPTNQIYWGGHDDVSDARLIADISVWASTNPNSANQAFNVTNGDYFTWRYMWPRLAEYLGANATSEQKFSKPRPNEGEVQLDLSLDEWSQDKRETWNNICDKAGCPGAKASFDAATWKFQDWVFQRGWCSTISINKARDFGWTKHIDSFTSFTDVFDKFVELGQIPKFKN